MLLHGLRLFLLWGGRAGEVHLGSWDKSVVAGGTGAPLSRVPSAEGWVGPFRSGSRCQSPPRPLCLGGGWGRTLPAATGCLRAGDIREESEFPN